MLAHGLTNRLLHAPTVALREAALEAMRSWPAPPSGCSRRSTRTPTSGNADAAQPAPQTRSPRRTPRGTRTPARRSRRDRRQRALPRAVARILTARTGRHALAAEAARADLAAAQAMRADPELRELAEEEIAGASRACSSSKTSWAQLVPRDPRDEGNLYLEVRAGTGGDEAAIFAGDLFRMYARYAERQGWKVEVESASPGEHGGYKEIVAQRRAAAARIRAEVRIRHPPRAARAGNRIAGPHPHLGRDGGDHARGREVRRRSRSIRPT